MSFLSFLQDSLIPANLYVIEINPPIIGSAKRVLELWSGGLLHSPPSFVWLRLGLATPGKISLG